MDDSQHIFPIDLFEDKPKHPSAPEKNSKNRHENEPNEDTQHLKFFPNRENETENHKESPKNKEQKKSKNKHQDVPDNQEQPDDLDKLDAPKPKPKNDDWKSGLVLGDSDIIKKLYSFVPEAKVYEVGNSIGRFFNQSENVIFTENSSVFWI